MPVAGVRCGWTSRLTTYTMIRCRRAKGIIFMGVLVIKCPVSGREFSTGIQTDAKSLALMPNEVSQARCPHCLTRHS